MGGHSEYVHEFSGSINSEFPFYLSENQRENRRVFYRVII
jgi:hypothetical protein